MSLTMDDAPKFLNTIINTRAMMTHSTRFFAISFTLLPQIKYPYKIFAEQLTLSTLYMIALGQHIKFPGTVARRLRFSMFNSLKNFDKSSPVWFDVRTLEHLDQQIALRLQHGTCKFKDQLGKIHSACLISVSDTRYIGCHIGYY